MSAADELRKGGIAHVPGANLLEMFEAFAPIAERMLYSLRETGGRIDSCAAAHHPTAAPQLDGDVFDYIISMLCDDECETDDVAACVPFRIESRL